MSDVIVNSGDISGLQRDVIALEAEIASLRREVDTANNNIVVVHNNLNVVDNNVNVIRNDVSYIWQTLNNFIGEQRRANRLGQAHTKLVEIRQTLERKYGKYQLVRDNTIGILQAGDLGIVKKETISTRSEELMLATPGYWLAPALITLSSWICDEEEIAKKALREAMNRDDEKTALFFGLVCRRACRKTASLRWIQRYLQGQDEEQLDRNAIVILDAYASGLLGNDSEGLVEKQISLWMDRLSAKEGFSDRQITDWTNAILSKRKNADMSAYPTLQQLSPTFSLMTDVMSGAELHRIIFDFFAETFSQEVSTEELEQQIDGVLTSLITDFDREEAPHKLAERLEMLVIEHKGDEDAAQSIMDEEKNAMIERKEFTRLLTDAAMHPELAASTTSTRKFSIALSKPWIESAYNDVCVRNEASVPEYIDIEMNDFKSKTREGENEAAMIDEFTKLEQRKMQDDISRLSNGSWKMYVGLFVAVMGFICMAQNTAFGFIIMLMGGGFVLSGWSAKKEYDQNVERIRNQYTNSIAQGIEQLRKCCAEAIDFRIDFEEKNAQKQDVSNFLDEISPEQYVRSLTGRRRMVQEAAA